MSDYYLDSSALVKRYVDEPGSVWIRQLTEPLLGNTILLAEISLAEVAAARLRGYDAVQLARTLVANQSLIAENLPVPTFVTSDTDLLTAAEAENLPIDNPLHHTEID